MKNLRKGSMVSATTMEFEASIFGAMLGAFGVGVLMAVRVPEKLALILIMVGIAGHAWAMYRMNRRG